MKISRLYICSRPITDKMKADRDRAAKFLSIPDVLEITNEYRYLPGILGKLKVESDGDIDEYSLRNAVDEPAFTNIHLILSDAEWSKLRLRPTLSGQCKEIDGQIITYARPHKGRRLLQKYLETGIQANLTEETLREWHELDHGIRAIYKIDPTSTHYHFYGYAGTFKDIPKQAQDLAKPRRYVRKPDPLAAWRDLWTIIRAKHVPAPKQATLLEVLGAKLAELRKQLAQLNSEPTKLVKPLRAWGQNVTQVYGNYNPTLYPTTGHHMGVDHASPKGTAIYAPADGEVVDSGYTKVLGNYVVYQYRKDRYLVALHLEGYLPIGTKCKAGETIGTVGDTGFIKGIHSHIEVWTIAVKRSALPANLAKTWRDLTRDPLKEF